MEKKIIINKICKKCGVSFVIGYRYYSDDGLPKFPKNIKQVCKKCEEEIKKEKIKLWLKQKDAIEKITMLDIEKWNKIEKFRSNLKKINIFLNIFLFFLSFLFLLFYPSLLLFIFIGFIVIECFQVDYEINKVNKIIEEYNDKIKFWEDEVENLKKKVEILTKFVWKDEEKD